MRHAPAVFLAAALCSPLVLCAQDQPEQPPAATFAWPVPSSAVVTETTLKKGREAKMRYTLSIAQAEDGTLRVGYSNFAFLEIGGRDVTSPAMQKALASALAMASAIPDYRISKQGEYIEVVGLDAMIQRIMPGLVASKGEAEARRMREIFARPQFAQLMQASMSKYWDGWVGAWTGWDLAAGEQVEQDTELPMVTGVIPAKVFGQHHGAVAEHPGHVRLTLRTEAKGDEVIAAMAQVLMGLVDNPQDDRRPEDVIKAVESQSRNEVITRLDTLVPVWALTEQRISVLENGKTTPRVQVERHEYSFDWSKR